MQAIKLAHYPNNEVRLTSYPVRARRFFNEPVVQTSELTNTCTTDDLAAGLISGSESSDGDHSPLSLPAISEPTPKSGHGGLPRVTQFGLRGKREIMRCGGAIEKAGYEKDNCLFLTATLAGSTDEAIRGIACYSGWLIDRLKSWLSKYARNRHEFYCWELQSRGALHLHYCIALDSHGEGVPILLGFQREWRALLLRASAISGIDLFARQEGGSWRSDETKPRCDAQRVRHSVTQYMAKYCTKDAGKLSPDSFCPSRWWGVSRPLMALRKTLTTIKEWVYPHINAAKRKGEEMVSFLENVCTTVHSYSSHCGRCEVKLGFHPPEDFEAVRQSFEDKKTVDYFLSRDGSPVNSGVPITRYAAFLSNIIPDVSPLNKYACTVKELCVVAPSPLIETEVELLERTLYTLSFLDSGMSSIPYECHVKFEDLQRISRFAWVFYRAILAAQGRIFPVLPDIDVPLMENPEVLEAIQLAVWSEGNPFSEVVRLSRPYSFGQGTE